MLSRGEACQCPLCDIDALLWAALTRRREAQTNEGVVDLANLAADLATRVEQWRTWAQFVCLDGGRPDGTDQDLQRRVCERQDADVQEARWEAQTPVKIQRTSNQIAPAAEYVQHLHGCPSIGGNGDSDCQCGAVTFLELVENLSVQLSAAVDALAKREAQTPASGWQPIETAPKDGTWFYARREPPCDGRIYESAFKWDAAHPGWFAGTGWWPQFPMAFTHWAPLPPLPRSQDGD